MSPDVGAATKFYTEVVGWGTQQWDGPAPYTMWTASELAVCARIKDVNASLESMKMLGGEVLYGPMDAPGGDQVAAVLDSQGAAFGLHQKNLIPPNK